MNKFLLVSCLLLTGLANAQSVEEVGDPDAFGRDVVHLGIVNTPTIFLALDCSTVVAPGADCVTLSPTSGTTFAREDVASLQLPARVSNSLLCFSLTPRLTQTHRNTDRTPRNASFTANVLVTIESPVLENAALIDRVTGQPFDGKFSATLIAHQETWTMQPGALYSQSRQTSRSCQNALVSKRTLMARGLTQSQANSFFNNRITVRLGTSGVVNLGELVTFGVGMRFYGDRR